MVFGAAPVAGWATIGGRRRATCLAEKCIANLVSTYWGAKWSGGRPPVRLGDEADCGTPSPPRTCSRVSGTVRNRGSAIAPAMNVDDPLPSGDDVAGLRGMLILQGEGQAGAYEARGEAPGRPLDRCRLNRRVGYDRATWCPFLEVVIF
jgi:hypothetical protein